VRHPNILSIDDIIEVDGWPMLVMDLIDGQSLGRYLARRGRLPLGEAAPILVRVVSAIGTAAAAGVVHRDLKPDNILLVPPAGGSAWTELGAPGAAAAGAGAGAAGARTFDVKVLDFGLAKLTATEGDAATSGDLTRDGDVIGTPHYMAPEQAFGEHVDHRADIWSLGVIMYECLAGERPFPGENLGQVLKRLVNRQYLPLRRAAPEVPDDVAALVDGMLAFDRSARPADLRGAHAVLSRYASDAAPAFELPRLEPESDGDTADAPSARTPAPGRDGPRRARWLGAGVALAIAAGAGGLALSSRARPAPPSPAAIATPATPPPVATAPPPAPPPSSTPATATAPAP